MIYTPRASDIVLLDFNPQSGHELTKRRPALVISNDAFNKLSGMAFFCPITSTRRDYPLRVGLDSRTKTHGFIACDQLKSLDYIARNCHYLESIPLDIFDVVLAKVNSIIGI